MKTINKGLLLLALATACNSAFAEEQEPGLKVFEASTPAKASEVNHNFMYLDGRLATLENSSQAPVTEMSIDCSDNADALKAYLATLSSGNKATVIATGECNGPLEISKDNLTVMGEDLTIIGQPEEDGSQDELYAVIATGSSNLKLRNLTIQSGESFLARGTNAKYIDVTMFQPESEVKDDGEVVHTPNVNVTRNASLRWEGSLTNLALRASNNSYVRIHKGGGEPKQLEVVTNSSLESRLDELEVSDNVYVGTNSTLRVKNLIADSLWLDLGAALEGRILSLDELLGLYTGSSMEVEAVHAKAMECHASSFEVRGTINLSGNIEAETGDVSFEAHHGCSGEVGVALIAAEGMNIFASPIEVDGKYLEVE
ncbi:MAG: hypothetical protein ACR2PT_14775 [Endozoicomonas sp.]